MFKRLTYSRIIKLLPAAFVVVLLFVYLIAIRETLNARNECANFSEQISAAGDAPQQIGLIQNKLDELSRIMGKDNSVSGTDPLLEFISISNADMRINLVDYMPLHVFQYQNYQVETRVAIFEGSYIQLLKFLYHLESEFKAGKVVSVKFESETNFKIDKKRLLMALYVQSVISQEFKAEKGQSQTN